MEDPPTIDPDIFRYYSEEWDEDRRIRSGLDEIEPGLARSFGGSCPTGVWTSSMSVAAPAFTPSGCSKMDTRSISSIRYPDTSNKRLFASGIGPGSPASWEMRAGWPTPTHRKTQSCCLDRCIT